MTSKTVHIRCNAGKARREKRDGRETIVLPSFAAKADSVLNDILYPREELEAAINTLDRVPAPMGHPRLNGRFISASDPEGMVRGFVGAWNENPHWDGDRIALDVVIDEVRANESAEGKALMNAIEKGEPISTSTGLFLNLEDAPDGSGAKHIGRNMMFDHVAVLLNEAPAISTNDGVGIFVNSAGEESEVVNSILEDDAMRELGWAVDSAVRAVERLERASLIDRIKAALIDMIKGGETSANEGKDADMADEKQLEELSAKVNGLEESITTKVAEAVANAIKPLIEAQNAAKADQDAKDKAELDDLKDKIVRSNLLDAETAGELTLNAARKLAEKAKPGTASALNAAPGKGSDDYDFNEVMGLSNKEGK